MKRLLLFLFFIPFSLLSQEEAEQVIILHPNVVKVRLFTTLFGTKNINLGYQRYLDNITSLELELFYTFGFAKEFTDETFSHTIVELQENSISGGLNVFSKHHLGKKNYLYASYGIGYHKYAYLKSHTVCTEVGTSVGGFCPCLDFSENIYERNVNQWSSEIRLGAEPPFLKTNDRFHFDIFLGIGARIMSVSEPNYLSHQFCSDDLSNSFNQEVLPEKFNKSTKYTAAGNKSLFFYQLIGIKLGYAF